MDRYILSGLSILAAATLLHAQTSVTPGQPASPATPVVPAAPTVPETALPASPIAPPGAPGPRPFVCTLTIGQTAPVLGINVWLKGTAVNEYQYGRVYVVEFWSPRVPACRRSGPVLSELATLFKDRGVTIISVATSESDGPGGVDAYVRQMGDKLSHSIAYDTTGDAARRFLRPSGQSGIPVAYIINEKEQIAWIGHPLDNLDRVLSRIADGSWDIIKAADEARRRAAAEEKGGPLVTKLEEQFAAGEIDNALATMDKLLAIDPPVMGEWAMTKFAFLLMRRRDADKAYAYAAAMLDGPLKDDAETLKAIAWMTLAEPGVVRRDIALARQIAQRADDLTKHADASVLDTLAKAQFDSGDILGAVQTQKLALEAAMLPSQKKELEQRLRQYTAAKKAEGPAARP